MHGLPVSNSRRVSLLAVPLAFALVLASVPATAQTLDQRIVTRPAPQPLAGEPFELVFLGEWGYFFDESGPQPEVVVEDGRITVTVLARFPVILPPITSYAIPIEMPPLDAGEYEVVLRYRDTYQDLEGVVDTGLLEVLERRAGVQALAAPLLAGESARIRLFADPDPLHVGTPEAVQVRDGTIFVETIFDTGIIDPPPPLVQEQVVETPPLDAGTYGIVILDIFTDAAVGLGELEVLPAPTLQDGRFDLALEWTDATGLSGPGRPVMQSDDSVLYHFFGGDNWELKAKVLDGCNLNGHYWVLTAASTDVAWELRIRDELTGTEWVGSNPLGERSRAMADVTAFACDPPPAAAELAHGTAPPLTAPAPAKTHATGWVESAAVSPPLVSDRQPAVLWVWGGSAQFGDVPLVLDVDVDEDARKVQVRFTPPADRVEDLIVPRDRKIELGRLQAGNWRAEIFETEVGPDGERGEEHLLLDVPFQVRRGFEIVSPLDNVGQPVASVPLDLAVVGPGEQCPDLDLVEVEEAGPDGERGLIQLAIREAEVCNTLVPPGPFQGAVSLGRLAPGVYDAVLTRPDAMGRIEFERRIEVLPDPLRVGDGRYEIDVRWRAFDGLTGPGRPAFPPSEDSALYWFFGPENWELMVKVLDGCAINGHVWVFGAASTNVEYTVGVRDTLTGELWTFTNPLGEVSPAITDVEAFACDLRGRIP